MPLTNEIINEIFPAARVDPTGTFTRDANRFVVSADVTLVQITTGPDNKPLAGAPKTAKLNDISETGAGLEFSEIIKVNETFIIRLPLKNGSALWVRCEGVRWSHIDGKSYSIGAKILGTFTKP